MSRGKVKSRAGISVGRRAIAVAIGLCSGWQAMSLPLVAEFWPEHSDIALAQNTRRSPFNAAKPRPPYRGTYVSEVGGAPRGCMGDQHLTAVVPKTKKKPESLYERPDVGGYTTQAQTDVWVNVPYEPVELNPSSMRLVIQTADRQELHNDLLRHPTQAGLMKVSLPKGLELEENQRVHWKVSVEIICPSKVVEEFAGGWIERVPEPDSVAELAVDTTLLEQAQALQQADIWYDAFNRMVELRASVSGSSTAVETAEDQWNNFLESFSLEPDSVQPLFKETYAEQRPSSCKPGQSRMAFADSLGPVAHQHERSPLGDGCPGL